MFAHEVQMTRTDTWKAFTTRIEELETLGSVAQLVGWDQQVNLPPAGAALRGRQSAWLARLHHERLCDPQLGALAAELTLSDEAVEAAAGRRILREHRRATALPAALVTAQAEATNAAFGAWSEARAARSFAPFVPALSRCLELLREAIAHHGPADHPYDHLLADFDPGTRTADLIPLFARLGAELPPLVASLAGRNSTVFAPTVGTVEMKALSLRLMALFGFDTQAGRLDETVHPFCSGIGPGDVRLTYKPQGDSLLGTLAGVMHETGHGLYEQGLPATLGGTGLRAAAGAAVHESQSRFWENTIGRSRPFCGVLARLMREQWPEMAVDGDTLFRAQNRVNPSLIRVHADEATYNLHILLRFELELALLSGDLPVASLPEAWDAGMERLLGLRPAHVVEGVLQDIHWGQGYFGYFPSYTLGNLYAAGLARQMELDRPTLWEEVAAGDLSGPLSWLREKVHQQGHRMDGPELIRAVLGERDLVADLAAHLRSRAEAALGD
jgi:carboxypeptidase Taq